MRSDVCRCRCQLQAAADDPRIKAVVAEGMGFRTLQDMFIVPSLANLSRVPGVWVMDNTSRLQSGVASPPPTQELIARIAPRAVFLIARGHSRRAVAQSGLFRSRRRATALWEPSATGHIAALETHPDEYEQRVVGFLTGRCLQAC